MSMCTIGHKNRQKGTNYKKKGREKPYKAVGISKILMGTYLVINSNSVKEKVLLLYLAKLGGDLWSPPHP